VKVIIYHSQLATVVGCEMNHRVIVLCFGTLCNWYLTLQCTEEAHRPVDCGTVAKWILKNSAESENMNW
jgi:hypothetical protein